MSNDMKIRQSVYERMQQEYSDFIENLKQQSPEKIMDSAYEKVMKEEILSDFCPEFEHYDMEQIKALNKQKEPLEELYQGWMDCDSGIHTVLEDSTYDTLEYLVQEEKQKHNSRER